MHGPSPSVYCSSSISVLTAFVVHTEPCGSSPDNSMIPAPDIRVISAHTTHSRVASPLPSSAASRDKILISRSSGITHRPQQRPGGTHLVVIHLATSFQRGRRSARTRSTRFPESHHHAPSTSSLLPPTGTAFRFVHSGSLGHAESCVMTRATRGRAVATAEVDLPQPRTVTPPASRATSGRRRPLSSSAPGRPRSGSADTACFSSLAPARCDAAAGPCAQPCSVMSGHTPVARSWSMARTPRR